ncbi:MAG TPA: S-layer homology domain-containing protein [Firmicutes bacterium]|nr:S-layer homology domain-containing protein [Bacillota bacterium]
MKRQLAILLSAAMVLGSSVTAMAADVTFRDLNDVPWEGAKNYILQAAQLDLMVGEISEDQTTYRFRAKDHVTYCEAVQLAYNILISQGEATVSDATTIKWRSAMSGYQIPAWAYEAVAYGLEHGIVTLDDLSGFMTEDGQSRAATREDVAIIFGRALNKGESLSSSTNTGFNDNGSISSAARPYVAYLEKKEILVGDDENNFNPKNLINRAEMAVLSTKTYSAISGESLQLESETVIGTVTRVSHEGVVYRLTIAPASTSAVTLTVVDGTPTKNGTLSEIAAGDNVTVEYLDGTALNLTVNDSPSLSQNGAVGGTLNNITMDRVVLNLQEGGSKIYELSPSAELFLNGELSSVSAIRSVLENGVEVDVTVGLSNGTAIRVEAQGEEDVVMGTITDLDEDEVTIRRNNGNERTYDLDRYVQVRMEGDTYNMKRLLDRFGDVELSVTAYLDDDNYVERMEVEASKAGGTVRGYVKSISEERIVVEVDGDNESYRLSKEPYVSYEGTDMTLSRLETKFESGTAMTVRLYLDSNKRVTRIIATIEDDTVGTIEKLDDNYITIQTDAGVEQKYLLDEDVVVELKDGSNQDLDYLQAVYETGETEVELQLNNSNVVIRIMADLDEDKYNVANGTIERMGEDSLRIDGKTIYTNGRTVVTIDGEDADIDQLKQRFDDGEEFGAVAAYSDNVATTIRATLEGSSGRVTDMKRGQITVKTDSGATKTYSLADDEDLVIRIDGRSSKYTFMEFYSQWYTNKINYDVELTFDEGQVINIEADTVS